MITAVSVNTYTVPEPDISEVLRYAGARSATEELGALVDGCISEARGAFGYKVCHTRVPISVQGASVDFGFAEVKSRALSKSLSGCTHAVLFCATVGIGIDRLINKYGALSPTRALVLEALGTERVECLCNVFCEDIKREFGSVAPRFSPGYGDLDIEFQRRIFKVLGCEKSIGVTLNDSLMMSPTKSVTAIVGVRD